MGARYDVFISYSRKDEHLIMPLLDLLRVGGKRVFRDVEEIAPGDEWGKRINEALDDSEIFILFWCCHAANSRWVSKEINRAIRARKKRLIPAVLCPMEIPKSVCKYQWVDFIKVVKHDCAEYRGMLEEFGPPEFTQEAENRIDPVATLERSYAVDADRSDDVFRAYRETRRSLEAQAATPLAKAPALPIKLLSLNLAAAFLLIALAIIRPFPSVFGDQIGLITTIITGLIGGLLILASAASVAVRNQYRRRIPQESAMKEELLEFFEESRESGIVSMALYSLVSESNNRRDD